MTPKQQSFVDEYLIDLNATQAAIRAGYSPKTAGQQGERLLKNVEIAAAVEKAREVRSEKTGIDAAWVLQRLAEEATADLSDLYDENGRLRSVHDWPLIWRQGLVQGIETVREKVGESKDGEPEYAIVQKVKLSDRIKRIELVGKHVNVAAFAEKMVHDLSDDAARLLLEARQAAR